MPTSGNRQPAFFDTNVLVYALLTADARSSTANVLLQRGGLVSVQVLNEFVSTARKKHLLSWGALRSALRLISLFCGPAIANEQPTHELAVDLAERHGFHIYDANIIASALLAGCETLYSEDGQRIDALTIRNPFTPGV